MKNILIISICILLGTPLFLNAQTKTDSIEYKIEGKIIGKTGMILKVQQNQSDTIPKIGDKGELSKYFESNIFGGKTTGWLLVAKVMVTGIVKNNITFKILKEESIITINGAKKNNFEIGKTVKFIWKIPELNQPKTE
ncbi:MAG: hypothetical protein HXX09_16625 [Bacteroidetes bacterium]|nr:hypothetical protein [Bacteroidota bacterium]